MEPWRKTIIPKEGTEGAGARGMMHCRAIETKLIGYCDYCYISGNKCEKLERYLEERMR